MHPTDTYDSFATEFSYPIGREEIIESAGDAEITAPTGTSESVGDVLDRVETRTFRSARELHETILSNLGEQYIGRKFYDDRGTNVGASDSRTI